MFNLLRLPEACTMDKAGKRPWSHQGCNALSTESNSASDCYF